MCIGRGESEGPVICQYGAVCAYQNHKENGQIVIGKELIWHKSLYIDKRKSPYVILITSLLPSQMEKKHRGRGRPSVFFRS